MIKLTARQQQVLDFIRSSLEETGFPPTRAEIAAELGFKSPNAAEEHLKAAPCVLSGDVARLYKVKRSK